MHTFHDLKGEQKDQVLILVDKEGKQIGTATRETCHKGEGKPHLAFMAFVLNEKKEIILAKRSTEKSLWDGFWDASVVSHVLSGETPEEAAKRRGREELGIEVDFAGRGAFYYFAKYGSSAENEYCHVLVGHTKETVTPNPVEISDIRTIMRADLQKEVQQSPEKFTPWLLESLNRFDLTHLI